VKLEYIIAENFSVRQLSNGVVLNFLYIFFV